MEPVIDEKKLAEELRDALQPPDAPQFVASVMARTHQSSRKAGLGNTRGLAWAGAALCLLLAVGIAERRGPVDGDPVARGGAVAAAQEVGAEVYRHPGGNVKARELLRDRAAFHSGDGLSFSLVNRGKHVVHVQLFAVDAHHEQMWFYPEEDAAKQHRSMTVGPHANFPLPDGITLDDLPAGSMQVVALFTDASLSIDDTAQALSGAKGDVQRLREVPHFLALQTLDLNVIAP